jgi:hypothetical protein
VAENGRCPLDNRRGVNGDNLEGALASEVQQLLGEFRRPLGRVQDLHDHVVAVGLAESFHLQKFGVALDSGQNVVEIVSHSTSQSADGFHLHRMMCMLIVVALPAAAQGLFKRRDLPTRPGNFDDELISCLDLPWWIPLTDSKFGTYTISEEKTSWIFEK